MTNNIQITWHTNQPKVYIITFKKTEDKTEQEADYNNNNKFPSKI